MKEKFIDYSVDDLVIVVEIAAKDETADKSKVYKDYDESDLIESKIILDDVFTALLGKDWQIIGRTKNKTIISEVVEHEIEDLEQIEILMIESEYFFKVLDCRTRFTSESIEKKVEKVKNSADQYHLLAEEVKVENLKFRSKGNK